MAKECEFPKSIIKMLVNYYYEHNKPSQQEIEKRKNELESEDFNNL